MKTFKEYVDRETLLENQVINVLIAMGQLAKRVLYDPVKDTLTDRVTGELLIRGVKHLIKAAVEIGKDPSESLKDAIKGSLQITGGVVTGIPSVAGRAAWSLVPGKDD